MDAQTYHRQCLAQLMESFQKAAEPHHKALCQIEAMKTPTMLLRFEDLPELTRKMLDGKPGELIPFKVSKSA